MKYISKANYLDKDTLALLLLFGQYFMKREYINPQVAEITLETTTMLAASSDRIPVGNGSKPPAASEHRGEWGNLW